MNHQKDTTTKLSRFDVMFIRICIVNDGTFSYTDVAPKSVWGFYDVKKRRYSAPINYSKQGDPVDINNTRPYTAMQLNLNPLMAAFA